MANLTKKLTFHLSLHMTFHLSLHKHFTFVKNCFRVPDKTYYVVIVVESIERFTLFLQIDSTHR